MALTSLQNSARTAEDMKNAGTPSGGDLIAEDIYFGKYGHNAPGSQSTPTYVVPQEQKGAYSLDEELKANCIVMGSIVLIGLAIWGLSFIKLDKRCVVDGVKYEQCLNVKQ